MVMMVTLSQLYIIIFQSQKDKSQAAGQPSVLDKIKQEKKLFVKKDILSDKIKAKVKKKVLSSKKKQRKIVSTAKVVSDQKKTEILPCSNCGQETVLYPCTCTQVVKYNDYKILYNKKRNKTRSENLLLRMSRF